MSNQLSVLERVREDINQYAPQMKALLPQHISQEAFATTVFMAIQQNNNLTHPQVDKPSLFLACMEAAQDGLLPNGKESALVIYNTNIGTRAKPNWIKKVTYMPMVGGIKKLVRNSGEILKWSINLVREGDAFDYALGDDEYIKHTPAPGTKRPIKAGYSIVKLKNGETSRILMWKDEIDAIRNRSRDKDGVTWSLNEGEMTKKTLAHRHYKDLPHSNELDKYMKRFEDQVDIDFDQVPVTESEPVRHEPPPEATTAHDEDKPIEGEVMPRNGAPSVKEIISMIQKAGSKEALAECSDLIRSLSSQQDKQAAGKAMYMRTKDLNSKVAA